MLVVLKLGGSAITDKTKEHSFKDKVVSRIGREIASVMKKKNFKLILVHGGGAYGHMSAKKYGLSSGNASKNKEGAERTNEEMDILVSLVTEKLKSAGLDPVAVRPKTLVGPDGIISMDVKKIGKLLESGSVPVICGFVAEDISGGWRILSGDTIAPHLAKKFKVDIVIMGSDVDGIYTDNPNTNKDAKLIPEINPRNVDKFDIGGSAGVDVSGGMRKKVDELLELTKAGISSRIINLNVPGRLRDALDGKDVVGTRIVP